MHAQPLSGGDIRAGARAAAVLLTAGGLWVLGGALAIPGHAGHGLVLAAALVLGVVLPVAGYALWRAAGRAGAVLLEAVAMGGVLLVGGLNLATHDTTTGSQLFMLWPALLAATYLDRRRTVRVLLWTILAQAVVMGVLEPTSQGLVDTIALALAFAGAATAVLIQRARADRLVAQLSAQAIEDPLTGLPNRRAFDHELPRLVALAVRTREPLSLLTLDVDQFKVVNDTRGHAAGDAALRLVAEALGADNRGADLVARIGGDEFAIILPGCPLPDATLIAAHLQEQVSAHTARAGEAVTVSIGVASMPEMATTPAALFEASDAALYASKAEGRPREAVRTLG